MRAKINPMILMPCYGGVPAETVMSLVSTVLSLGIRDIKFSANMSMPSHARDKLAKEFLDSKCTHAIWIDSDMTWTPHDVQSLLTRNLPIVGGLACKKADGEIRVASTLVAGAEIDGRGLVEAVATGMAFIVIHRGVFEHMVEHYGEEIVYTPGGMTRYHLFPEFEHGKFASEDTGFCYRARELGYKIMLDTNVRIGHVGPTIYPMAGQLALMQNVYDSTVIFGKEQKFELPRTSDGRIWNE